MDRTTPQNITHREYVISVVSGTLGQRWSRFLLRDRTLVAVCLIFLGLGIARLNDLSMYTPDSTDYLIWGNSLAQGKGFIDETLPEPDRFVIQAPLYPILISPVEFVFPYSEIAAKAVTLLMGVGALGLFFILITKTLGRFSGMVAVILLACNPLMLLYSTEILSDVPFLAAVLFLFYLVDRDPGLENMSKPEQGLILFANIAVALLREVGIVVTLSFVLYCLLRKKYGTAILVVSIVGLLLAGWYFRNRLVDNRAGNLNFLTQQFVSISGSSVAGEFGRRMWTTLQSYGGHIGGFLFFPLLTNYFGNLLFLPSTLYNSIAGVLNGVGFLIVAVAAPLMLLGLYRDAKTSPIWAFRLIFVVLYLSITAVYPINDIRFLLPLLPVQIYYTLLGVAHFRSALQKVWASPKLLGWGGAGLAMVAIVPNLAGIYEMVHANLLYNFIPGYYNSHSANFASSYTPLYTRPWQEMGAWVRSHTDGDVVIASPYKQAATVIGGRKLLLVDRGITLPAFEKLIRDYHVSYLAAPNRWGGVSSYEALMQQSKRLWFDQVAEISGIRLFHVHSQFMEPRETALASVEENDSLNETSLMRAAWICMGRGDYHDAGKKIERALIIDPSQPEILYYAVIAAALQGDTTTAREYYGRLFVAPQSGSFVEPARDQLRLASQFARVQMMEDKSEQAAQGSNLASEYWRKGFPERAISIIRNICLSDTMSPLPHLLGTHYALQLGDTLCARRYLHYLTKPPVPNAVAVVFDSIIRNGEMLHREQNRQKRSEYHLRNGNLYNSIGLSEESLDEAELALFEDVRNEAALAFLANTFLKRGCTRHANELEKMYLQSRH